MGLIIKGETKTISKKEMKNRIGKLEDNKDGMAGLTESQKEVRKEIQDAKRHREFMNRVAKQQEKDIEAAGVVATSEVVTEVGHEPIVVEHVDVVKVSIQEEVEVTDTPDFQSMTKKQLDEWAEENLGIQLDRRHTKAKLIEEIKENL
jgi:hypothetical protein